jgi:hypothetical protein
VLITERCQGAIAKPLPPEWFTRHESSAEMRWEALRGQGHVVPNERFFVRNHTSTPRIDPRTYRLELFGAACAAGRCASPTTS